ncbi:MAG TPA: hypothetical protein VKD72_38410, partial [Gemmataceae bacterium]|nr:hypothetical protein [Gemmataceae bacterium]
MLWSPQRLIAQSRQHRRATRPRPVRPRLEALEDRLAPDGSGLSAEPNQLRQLMAWGNANWSQEDLMALPEFYEPDLAAINAPVGGQIQALGMASLTSLVADPGAMGPLAITAQDYDFGNERFDPVSIAGTAKVELTARIWAPTDLTGGPRPLLLFLHGNHSSVFSGTTAQFTWPPPAGFQPIPNHMGYGSNPFAPGVTYLADVLASHGYIVVSVSA